MKKKSGIAALVGIGVAAAAGAAAVVAYQKIKEQEKLQAQLAAEEAILLDLDGDGEVDAKLEDLDGDGAYDTVTTGVSLTETSAEMEVPAEAGLEGTANEDVAEMVQTESAEAAE